MLDAAVLDALRDIGVRLQVRPGIDRGSASADLDVAAVGGHG